MTDPIGELKVFETIDGTVIGYVMSDGMVLCLTCAAKFENQTEFDNHYNEEHG